MTRRFQVAAVVSLLSLVSVMGLPRLLAQDSDASAPAAEAPAGQYLLDPAHSQIHFMSDHLGISKICGRFNEFDGGFTLGEEPSFEATIQTASVDTGVEQRDDHLRSPDFFDARQYPTITFKSKEVTVEGTRYTIVGDLTMHGQTKEIELTLNYGGTAEFYGQRAGFFGGVTIDRSEWGLDAWEETGMVGGEIVLIVGLEGILQ